jgi:hypothetical protein
MMSIYVLDHLLLGLIEGAANLLLRAAGGPHHVPQSNEDFVWF